MRRLSNLSRVAAILVGMSAVLAIAQTTNKCSGIYWTANAETKNGFCWDGGGTSINPAAGCDDTKSWNTYCKTSNGNSYAVDTNGDLKLTANGMAYLHDRCIPTWTGPSTGTSEGNFTFTANARDNVIPSELPNAPQTAPNVCTAWTPHSVSWSCMQVGCQTACNGVPPPACISTPSCWVAC